MSRLTFVHTADLHLGSPFSGMHEECPEVAEILRSSTFDAFQNIIEICEQHKADFLLIAGDVYDSEDRQLRPQLRFRDGVGRLAEAGIQTFVVHGNHDSLDGWTAKIDWPPEVHIFGDKVETLPVIRDGEEIARVSGISFGTARVTENLCKLFPKKGPGSSFSIGLLHCNVGSDTGHEAYAPCTVEDMVDGGMDYWALGHVHNKRVHREAHPAIVYPGTSQGRSPREPGARGCFVVRVEDDGSLELEFVPTDAARWQSEVISISDLSTLGELQDKVAARCQTIAEQADGRTMVVRIRLEGRGPLHRELRRSEGEELTEAMREAHSLDPTEVWVESVELATQPEVDIEALRKGEDTLGDFLKILKEARLHPAKRKDLVHSLDALYQSTHGRRHLELPSDEEVNSLLEQAAIKGLDLLHGNEE